MRLRVLLATVAFGITLSLFGSIAYSAFTNGSTEATADATAPRDLAEIARSLEVFIPKPLVAGTVPLGADGVGLVDPTTGIWHLRTPDGDPASFYCRNPGDTPFVGDFDGDDIDTIGLYRASTGLVYFRNANSTGKTQNQFYFGDPADRFVISDWNGDGISTPAVFWGQDTTLYFRFTNTQGVADARFIWGEPDWIPVAGTFTGG